MKKKKMYHHCSQLHLLQVMGTRAETPRHVQKVHGQRGYAIGSSSRVGQIQVSKSVLQDIIFFHEHITYSF